MTNLIIQNDHYFCEISVNNIKAKMLLDTGASISRISDDFTQNSKLVGYASGAGQTGVIGDKKKVKEISDIVVDSLKLSKHRFIIDSSFKQHFDCDGILGIDILSQSNFKIDFRNLWFRFDSFPLTDGINFSTNKNKIFFNPLINGVIISNLVFDTGAFSLSINKKLIKKLDLEFIDNDPELEISDANNNKIDYLTLTIECFELGSLSKRDFTAYGFSFENSRKLKKFDQNGIIGKSIFEDFSFTFDFDSGLCKIE